MRTRAKYEGARISFKKSIIICKAIRGLSLEKGKKLLEDLVSKKASLDGKYHTDTSKKILEILSGAEANAKQKDLKMDKLFINAKADKGFRLITQKSRAKFRGRKAKTTNIEIILEER